MNPRIVTVAGAISAALACAAPASADIHQLEVSGRWQAYSGAREDNRALCGIGTEGAETRRILIEQHTGETGLELLLRKDSWEIPANTPIVLQVQVDGGTAMPFQATGSDHQVTVDMTFDETVPLMRGIRAGRQILISFPSGNETPWTGGLSGSARAINAFNKCRNDLGPAQTTAPTQPFEPPPAVPPSVPPSVQSRP
jgi:hypothetical protein